MPQQPTPEERVTEAIRRAHWRAETRTRETARTLERTRSEHWGAIQAHADALAEVAAMRGALADRGAPTWEELEQARRAAMPDGFRLHAGTIATGRLVTIGPPADAMTRAREAQHANDVARGLPGILTVHNHAEPPETGPGSGRPDPGAPIGPSVGIYPPREWVGPGQVTSYGPATAELTQTMTDPTSTHADRVAAQVRADAAGREG